MKTLLSTDTLLRFRAVAERLDVSTLTLRRWARKGLLPVVWLTPRSPRIPERALEEFLAARLDPATSTLENSTAVAAS